VTPHLDGPRGRGLTDSLISFPFLVPLFDSAVSKELEKKSKAGVSCIRAGGRAHLHHHCSWLSLERQAWSPSELLTAVNLDRLGEQVLQSCKSQSLPLQNKNLKAT